MKQLIGIFLAIIVIPASSAFGHVGGPFSDNSFFQASTDGIYQAVATLSNGVGIYRFAVRNNSTSVSTNDTQTPLTDDGNVNFGNSAPDLRTHTWFYRGVTYGGNCFGVADQASKTVTAIGNASTNNGVATTITAVDGTVATASSSTFVAGPVGGNIGFANSSWTADITQEFPVIRFSGNGEVSFLGAADTTFDSTNITVATSSAGPLITTDQSTTVETDTDTAANGAVTTSVEADVTTNETAAITSSEFVTSSTSTGGEDTSFSQVGARRTFIVFGSRTSTIVSP